MSAVKNLWRSLMLASLCTAPAAFAEMPSMRAPHEAFMPGMGGGALPPRAALEQLDLSEAQQDKLFQLHHQQAPAIHAQRKAERKAHEALQALIGTAEFTAAKARELAQAEAQARAELVLLQAQAEHQFLSLLSPEQRKALDSGRAREPGRPGEGPRGGGNQPPAPRDERR
ncbi:Spy/CpxP family protein refolding chaperone [Uliginosibacterium sp. 31-12]|uniref:Spy/CpxP family protein refolding chaperone n=1 Tax=Uliginosibacterium sp. 31-12 TaxID=3062781 RepID=UPI0026E40374|nr:Spy/CpxP family protein refolding chaperone [Uliginosibacterium sp. 31-12]MDO6384927.1 Spy/CpxP family protein refolding chaperone [Uliginosibacterium sp. 31-12]